MTAAIVAGSICYVVWLLTVLAICADSKRRDNAQRTRLARTLFEACVLHVADGGDLDDVVAVETVRHPSGATRVRLILRGDVADGAERLLRIGGLG